MNKTGNETIPYICKLCLILKLTYFRRYDSNYECRKLSIFLCQIRRKTTKAETAKNLTFSSFGDVASSIDVSEESKVDAVSPFWVEPHENNDWDSISIPPHLQTYALLVKKAEPFTWKSSKKESKY